MIRGQRRITREDRYVSGREFTTNSASSSSVCSTSSFGALVCSGAQSHLYGPDQAFPASAHMGGVCAAIVSPESSPRRTFALLSPGDGRVLRLRPRSLCRGRYSVSG
ncbi:hypothetical protein EVAR_91255_1 [Eumeta japonica]|uniref:Uncharacterized protein n=1 Tax=Eumeta variegata TaxID=151549 RepID=A0A4C2A310_EUMVA|nr:hypothetical protein EVAR_91255_1 [Eumeta japonica]